MLYVGEIEGLISFPEVLQSQIPHFQLPLSSICSLNQLHTYDYQPQHKPDSHHIMEMHILQKLNVDQTIFIVQNSILSPVTEVQKNNCFYSDQSLLKCRKHLTHTMERHCCNSVIVFPILVSIVDYV